MFDPAHVITTVEQLRAVTAPPRAAQQTKVVGTLDDHGRRWIGRSPFVVIASVDATGRMDVSPKGDPPGFVRILDASTIAIPDRPGNRRLDTFENVIQNPRVAVMFMVPGRGEVLRVGGNAQIVTEPSLMNEMVVAGRPPAMALVVNIDEVMFHCGKSVIRSKLWSPDEWASVDGLASYAQILADQTEADETVEQMETRFATWHDGKELY
ncbi:MAG: MSMEG_1061 family FMN-dependent PPOX-type flavoprotein [Actinomycetota bacterium]